MIEYKLVDVPELGYFTTDLPYPRGELLVKTQTIIPVTTTGPRPPRPSSTRTASTPPATSWPRRGPDRLVYVDRRNNVLKLSQGEFVAVSRLESVYVTSPALRQIYVYGNSARAYLLAVVVPSENVLERAANEEELKRLLSEALQEAARRAELEPYAIPATSWWRPSRSPWTTVCSRRSARTCARS